MCQAESQSYATSYIPTNGSTQTRAAESSNGAGTSSIFVRSAENQYWQTMIVQISNKWQNQM